MLVFPNAKINLGLNITGIRTDGFHDIETEMIPIALCDALEIISSDGKKVEFRSSGLLIPGNEKENLCIQAYTLLKEEFHIPAVKIHLHKVIPMGAGLGGGSSDAAWSLKLLNAIFNLNLTANRLLDYARLLGSDCAFFIENIPVFATGKGDQFEKVPLNLQGYSIAVIVPPVHVSTAEAYKTVSVKKPAEDIRYIMKEHPREWKDRLINDFEGPVFQRYSILKKIKGDLYNAGAVYASMSGSGSAVFGLFERRLPEMGAFAGCYTWTGKL